MMSRRKLLLGFTGVAIVSGLLIALVLSMNRESEEQLPEGIIGSWKSADSKSDMEITFWRSGDFQISKTFGDKRLVKGKGTWELQNQKLLLSIYSTDPSGYESNVEWNIVSVTKLNLVCQVNERYTLERVIKEGVDFDSPGPPPFKGSSDTLERTVFVPTLETSLRPGRSAIWCATLSMAWQQLEMDVLKEPAELEGNSELAGQLNRAPKVDLLPAHYYVAAGLFEDGIIDRIRKELSVKFPKAPLPPEDVVSKPGQALAFAYLETAIRYEFAFMDIDKPMRFKDSQGRPASVRAFGIREEDKDSGADTYRKQVMVLFRKEDDFALDLSQNTRPYQIILARMGRKATLKETLADLEVKVAKGPASSFGKGGILGVPNMDWHLEHHFKELEGKKLRNRALPPGSLIKEAWQFVKFKIDRRGVELFSGGLLGSDWNGSHPEDFRFDRPYLILLRNRQSRQPFFVMWVDNAELMQNVKWRQ
jgi:hypothetical protein